MKWLGSFGFDRRRYEDPLGEIGLAVDEQRTHTYDAYLSPRLRVPLWRAAHLGLVASFRNEWVDVDEAAQASVAGQPSGDASRSRTSLGAGLELEQQLFDRRLTLVPAVHIDAVDSRFSVAAGEGEQDDAGRDHLLAGASPRLALRLGLVDGLEYRMSGGRYFRAPTLLELFGDRGYMLGDEGLAAEHGSTLDGGFVLDLRELGPRGTTRVYGHLAGFVTWATDLIQWVQSGPVVRPTNIEGARLGGFESGLSIDAWKRALALTANYTFTETANLEAVSGKRGRSLPGRPRHQIFGRASTGGEFSIRDTAIEPRVFYTFEYLAGAYLDPSERLAVAPRALHGIGTELHLIRRLHLAFEIRNLLDNRLATWNPPGSAVGPLRVPVADYVGYPLPGRSLWGSVRLDLEVPRHRRAKSRPPHRR
jgi:iron complex outermembrane receptor protein